MELSDLLNEIDFETWLDDEDVTYRKTVGKHGQEFNIRECPVCGGNEWKVYINARTNLGVCFHGSHPLDMQFNKWRFMSETMDMKGREFVAYLEHTHDRLGGAPKPVAMLESMTVTDGEVLLPNHDCFTPTQPLPAYLAERGVTHGLARYFDFRMCHSDASHMYWDDANAMFRTQSFNDRILIPIYDLDGQLRTFQGRDVLGTAEKKYLFPATLPASGRFLYNGFNAIGKETVVVGEGAFDVLGIKRALFNESPLAAIVEPIGTFGMSLSGGMTTAAQDQMGEFIKLKQAGLKTVVMMWDSEDKTIKHLIDAITRLRAIGLIVKVAALPDGYDPGDAPQKMIINAYYRAKLADNRLKMALRIKGIKALLG